MKHYDYYDVLKAFAIIAVVLYHMGLCEYGYLGVDIFLVIAGYFTSKSIDKHIDSGRYLLFISNRIFRLGPLLLIAGTVCLVFGCMMMLPDDLENLAQSIVATNFFGNNILAAITTKNYWDVSNNYKPLMHTWYIGLLMQFYVIIPFLFFAVGKIVRTAETRKRINIAMIATISIGSLALYLFSTNNAFKFYFLPYRLYEFGFGSLAFYLFGAVSSGNIGNKKLVNIGMVITYVLILALLFIETDIVTRPVKLLSIVSLTAILLILMPRTIWVQGKILSNKWLACIGSACFSIFVWHQILIALTRYSFTINIGDLLPFVSIIAILTILSALSYKYIEQVKKIKTALVFSFLLLVVTTSAALYIYKIAGVVRDVPELEVFKGNVHRGMWAEYCDRAYKYDKDFTETEKYKWYVIGNSFGRDMVNIILESHIADSVEVSYSYISVYQDKKVRFLNADVVFLSTLGLDKTIIEDVKSRCSANAQFFIIGEKNFGESNGQIYRHRFSKDYHNMTIHMEDGYAQKNEQLKAIYPDNYIDMIEMVKQIDGRVRVFTSDGHFISQDCRHLTKAGAQYYAEMMDWNRFLK